jgi:hypothetical protein
MAGDKNKGTTGSISGGIPPDKVGMKRILVEGKETGIDHLDFIIGQVKKLQLTDDDVIACEIMMRVKEFNSVPPDKEALYAEALLREYRRREAR